MKNPQVQAKLQEEAKKQAYNSITARVNNTFGKKVDTNKFSRTVL